MTTYESDIKTISSSEEMVFGVLSDLNNLQKISNNPEINNKIKDLKFETDSVCFSIDGFGRVGFRIIEREPFKTIKLESENTPIHINGWIQLKQVSTNDTHMKLTLKADLPMMVKMMVDKKLKEGINAIADVIAKTLSEH
ncbi:MAG: SRPBCC family protein [Paludibacter sp.]|nr:SRPBCC family protein [Paludibacter sp.]